MPGLSRLTACIDLISMTDSSHHWMAFSYITNNTLLGRKDIALGLAGDQQQLILYNFGKTFYISYHLTPFHWHTMCLTWDGVKGRLELFRNKERILAIMDQPHSLPSDGTLFLGHFPGNGESPIKTVVPRFTGSLYYFQLWDRILENEEFMTCLYGNVVTWEDDVWLMHKISPTADRRLRCFVSENMTIQERSTTVSQQIDLTTPSQITGLNAQKTVHLSIVSPESMPISTVNHAAISHSNTIPSPLATVSVSKDLKTSMAQTATFSDGMFTSTAIPLPTQSTPIPTATDSMKVTQYPHLGKTKTTKIVEVMATETFHPTTVADFFDTSGITRNSVVPETLTSKFQSAVGKTTLFLVTESTSMSTTSWCKHKHTDVATLSTSKSGQEFLVSPASRPAPWSTLEETSAIATDIGIASTFPPESLLTSTAAPMNPVFSGNHVTSTLSTTNAEMAFAVHSVLPMKTTPSLRTAKTESVSRNFQDVSSSKMEDAISTPMPKETSPMAFSSTTSSPVIGTQGVPTVDTESTHLAFTPRTKLVPPLATSVFSTIEGLVHTQNMPTTDEPMLTLISTESSTYNSSESGLTSVTEKTDYQFFTTWTPEPDQTLLTSRNTTSTPTFMPNENLTSSFQDNIANIDNSSMTTNITLLETSTDSKGTTNSDATTARYTTVLSKPTSQWLSNFSSVAGITSITSQPESKLTTFLWKSNSKPTVAANELPSIPRETVVPSVAISTLTSIKSNFSTEKSTSKMAQVYTNGMSTLGDTMVPPPMSATIQRFHTTVAKETTSHHPKVKSTIAAVAEVSPFAAMLEATDESARIVTASVTASPFPDIDKLTTALDNQTATTGMGVSWLSTKLMQSTLKSSPEPFNSTHTCTVHRTAETSERNSASSPISPSTQTLPELLGSSTRIMGATFSTTSLQKTAVSFSASSLPPQAAATHPSEIPQPTTHKFSLPVNVSAVTSPASTMVFFSETKVTLPQPATLARDATTSTLSVGSPPPTGTMTTAAVPPVSPIASTASDILPTHSDSFLTMSVVTTVPFTTAPMAASSLRPPTPVITKAITTLPPISADSISPSVHTLICSRPPPKNITLVSSTYANSTTSTSVATPSGSQVEDSTHVFSSSYTLSSSGDVGMASRPAETSTGGESMSLGTFVDKLTTSAETKSTAYIVNTPISTQLAATTSMLSSEKEQTKTSMGQIPRTTRVAEISPSKTSFILDSQGTFPWEMSDTEFSETTEISSHQTHLPSEIPPGNPTSLNFTTSSSGSTQTTETLTSSTIVGLHVSEGSTSLEETTLPSQIQTTTKSLSPDKERTSALLEYPPRTVEKIESLSAVTHSDTSHQVTSSVDTTTSRTARTFHPVLINTVLSHLRSPKTQPESTWIASSTSESTQTLPQSFSPLTPGPLDTSFTVITPDGSTTIFSAPNKPINFPGETSTGMSTPIHQMSSLPLSITTFTPKKVSDTHTILMTKSSRTTNSGHLKSVSIGTSGLKSEKSSVPVNNSVFSTTVLSSNSPTSLWAFSSSLSSPSPKHKKPTHAPTLGTTPVSYAGPPSQSTVVSPTFANSTEVEVPFKNTTAPVSFPTELDFSSMKTIPTVMVAGTMTSVIGATSSSPLSSRNTEAISFTLKTMFASLLSTTQQPSQENAATTLDMLPGITNSSPSPESSGEETELINTYSATPIPASGLSATPSDSFYTSSNIQVSPSLTNFKGTPTPTEGVKSTQIYLSRDTGKMTSSSENTLLTSELTSGNGCVVTPALCPSRTQPPGTPPSLASFLYSPHSTEAKFPLTSQMGEVPAWGTRITPGIAQSLSTASRNTAGGEEDAPLPVFTTSVMTPDRVETESPHFTLGTSSTSQIGLVSRDSETMPSIFTSESLPTFGLSENTSISISSTVLPTTLAVISGATSPTRTLSSLPSGSLASVSNPSHRLTSSAGEMAESMFLVSDTIAASPNFPTVSFSDGSTTPTQSTPPATLGIIAADSLTSPLISTKAKGESPHTSTSLESSPRTTVAHNSRTASEFTSFSRKSISPSVSSHDLSTTSTAIGPSFPLMSAEKTHPSTSTGSSLISSSFKSTWVDSTFSFLFTQASTSPIATVSTVSFYNIKITFSVFDEESRVLLTTAIHDFTKDWLNYMLQNSEFSLANLTIQIISRKTSEEEVAMYRHILEQKNGQGMATIFHVPYSCACWVIIKANSSLEPAELISRIQMKIYGNLTHANFIQDQLTLLVKSDRVVVEKLEPGKCETDETPSKYKGTYKWPLTDPTETAQVRCIKNENGNATRICSINIQTGKCQWEKPRFKQCKLLQELPDKIMDLANITISDENADDVAEHILNLVNKSTALDEEETKIIVSKVTDISNCDDISANLTQMILQIISTVTEKQSDSASNLPPVSNKILRIIERAGHKMKFVGRTANLTVARLALAVLRVDHMFEGMAFSIHASEEVTNPQIFLGSIPVRRVLASIYLPKSLGERVPVNGLETILFNFFGQTSLFKAKTITTALMTYVVSASISNMSIQNLDDPVIIILKHIQGNWNYDQVYCAFWDFDTNHGLGGWNSSGCEVKESNVNYTICQCNHLTHFGVLMDLSRSTVDAVNERILVIITYTGCGISSIFLGIAMVTYIAFHKLRKDYPSKILINLCTALLMLNLAFLVNSWLASFQSMGLCITAALALHYFLLVSLTWMGLEAVHMYFALVKVFNTYIPNYILKLCLAGWGIPAITVAIILSIRTDLYGTLNPATLFCWIKDDRIFYISVVAYFCLIFLMNLSMFCTVLVQLTSVKSQSQKTRKKMILNDLRGTISLTFLLGLTWGFAFFAWGPVRIFFMYLFAICNTLQGFLIFVFYCVMKESVREQWHTHLCCRWLRLGNFSGKMFGINIKYKQKKLKKTHESKLLTPSLKSTTTNSTFKSIGSVPSTPSEINFPNGNFDDGSCTFSSLDCEAAPTSIRRALTAEIKANSVQKQRSFSRNVSRDAHLAPGPGLGEIFNL
ncbi:adhesion G-protein coupled receptor G4 [Alexandromys fortis]|uniref:adhesion G-protein coupled receptor G4 n=1 Tax=Alexandromys fortis TaxID=100897 RepID=UPI0021521C1E|nr:adhesion G-protein coupled receptor G4 [Microtus fortis]